MEARPQPRWLYDDERRLRWGWRIVLFLALFLVLSVAGQLTASLLPRESLTSGALLFAAAAALAAGLVMTTAVERRPPGALGFAWHRGAAGEVLVGLGVGAGLILLAVLLLLATRSAYFVPDEGEVASYLTFLLRTLLFFWVAAAWEELLFRGYAFQALVDGVGPWPAVLASSLLFAGLHGWNPNVNWLALVNIFLAGILLAVAYLRTRSLWFATALHVGWNWAMASLFDFPVSGLTSFETPLYDTRVPGADWWTGGDFGPEAGAVGTIVLGAGTVWLLRSRLVQPAERVRALRPIVDRRLGDEWR